MAKYMSVVIGSIVTLIGVFALIAWFDDLIMVLKGSVPIALIFAGAIAVIAGLSEIKDENAAGKK